MKKSTRVVLRVLLLLGVLAYTGLCVLAVLDGPTDVNKLLIKILIVIAAGRSMYDAGRVLFSVIDIIQMGEHGPFGRTPPLDEVWRNKP